MTKTFDAIVRWTDRNGRSQQATYVVQETSKTKAVREAGALFHLDEGRVRNRRIEPIECKRRLATADGFRSI